MKLIRKLGRRKNKTGTNYMYWGLFKCDCGKEVERQLGHGKRDKSCGCYQDSVEYKQKISKSLKGRKYTEKRKRKMSISKLKFYKENPNIRLKISKSLIGKTGGLARNWQNGISFEIYPQEFNKELKHSILERDNYECQCTNCEHKSIKLHIHHIDYDKKNNNPGNLTTLCNSCHSKTNGKNRQYWIEFYQNIMMNRGF